jgi:hypothetical protein
MRLALLGPVSPVALAGTVFEVVRSGRRTPTGGAFQLVEILACLNSARLLQVAEKLSEPWQRHLSEAFAKTARILDQLISEHQSQLDGNKAFKRYQNAVLGAGSKPNV